MSGAKMSGLEPTGASAVPPARPEPILIEPSMTALAVVDTQNGTASPSGYFDAGGSDPVISKKPGTPWAMPCSTRHPVNGRTRVSRCLTSPPHIAGLDMRHDANRSPPN